MLAEAQKLRIQEIAAALVPSETAAVSRRTAARREEPDMKEDRCLTFALTKGRQAVDRLRTDEVLPFTV